MYSIHVLFLYLLQWWTNCLRILQQSQRHHNHQERSNWIRKHWIWASLIIWAIAECFGVLHGFRNLERKLHIASIRIDIPTTLDLHQGPKDASTKWPVDEKSDHSYTWFLPRKHLPAHSIYDVGHQNAGKRWFDIDRWTKDVYWVSISKQSKVEWRVPTARACCSWIYPIDCQDAGPRLQIGPQDRSGSLEELPHMHRGHERPARQPKHAFIPDRAAENLTHARLWILWPRRPSKCSLIDPKFSRKNA